jgi:tetratricopeptide (TPR) repeat protein
MKNLATAFALLRLASATFVATACVVAVFGMADANAQKRDNDYYAPHERDVADSLRAVEQYHLGPGEKELRLKQYVQAFSDLIFVLHYFPNHPQALLLMAQLCTQWKSGQCDADSMFQRAVEVNPAVPGTYATMGIYLHRNGRYADAIDAYKRALALNPDSVNANYNIGLAYLDTKQYELANVHAQRAYASGAPLPGLRDKLKLAGHWHPSAESPPGAEARSPAAAGSGNPEVSKPGQTE